MSKFDKVLMYKELFPQDLVAAVERYRGQGCKSRSEYEFMINNLFPLAERKQYL